MLKKFNKLSKDDPQVFEMRRNLVKALLRLKEGNDSTATLASYLYRTHFSKEGFVPVEENSYDVSAEMAKLLQTMVNGYEVEYNVSREKREYSEQLLSQVDFASLIS